MTTASASAGAPPKPAPAAGADEEDEEDEDEDEQSAAAVKVRQGTSAATHAGWLLYPSAPSSQGLTLVHFSAQREPFLTQNIP